MIVSTPLERNFLCACTCVSNSFFPLCVFQTKLFPASFKCTTELPDLLFMCRAVFRIHSKYLVLVLDGQSCLAFFLETELGLIYDSFFSSLVIIGYRVCSMYVSSEGCEFLGVILHNLRRAVSFCKRTRAYITVQIHSPFYVKEFFYHSKKV